MARETGIYRRPDSRFWWIATTLPNGKRLRFEYALMTSPTLPRSKFNLTQNASRAGSHRSWPGKEARHSKLSSDTGLRLFKRPWLAVLTNAMVGATARR